MKPTLLYTAWKKLILTFVLAYVFSLLAGIVLVNMIDIAPETIFRMSTKRLSYALPVMDMGTNAGIDGGIILFIWNTIGALTAISFTYTAALFNPLDKGKSPKAVRNFFCSPPRMKLLCFLPGCMKINEESLRRLYVWLMVPYIGMILLGIEVGFTASTAKPIFGSYLIGFIALLPHGVIEIPAIALAGAVTYSAHLLIKHRAHKNQIHDIFNSVKKHGHEIPLKKVILAVVICLFIAGFIEAHLTQSLLNYFQDSFGISANNLPNTNLTHYFNIFFLMPVT
jgi:hypothetical protein